MRLSKRIAAVALAAVMAVSMLTACGGGGGGSTGGSNSGNGGSNNGNNSSNVGGDTNGGNTGSGSDTTLGPIDSNVTAKKTTWKDSRTGKFFGSTGKVYFKYKGTYEGTPATIEQASNLRTHDVYMSFTIDNIKCFAALTEWKNNKYYEIYYKEIQNLKNDGLEGDIPEKYKGKDLYMVEPTDKNTPKAMMPNDNTEIEICEYEYPENSGKKYYAEKATVNGYTSIYCYNFTSGKLELLVMTDALGKVVTWQYYEEVKNNYPDSLMKLPEGAIEVTEKDLKDAELNK